MDNADKPSPAPKRVRNIAELAKIAGVSAGTVSRALAGKSLVNAETRERIQALARDYGFRPNQMASKLRRQRTGVIGIVIPLGHERRQQISDPFFMTLLGHLADALTDRGYDLMLSRVVPDATDWLERITESGMLDGVLLIGQSNQVDEIDRVAQHYRPIVVWGAHGLGAHHCTVGSDNLAGGRLAAERLITTGRRRIAFLGDVNPPEIAARFAGANKVVAAAGLSAVEALPIHLASAEAERDLAEHLGDVAARVDGLICASDVIAMNALRVLADHNIAVPDQIAVVGFDDLAIATQTVPRLTTVHQDIAGGAMAMVEALLVRVEGRDTPSVVMAPTLVVRDSA